MPDEKFLYNLELSDKFKPTLEEVKQFIEDKVLPVEEEFFGTPNKEDRWALSQRSSEILEGLKSQAKEKGLAIDMTCGRKTKAAIFLDSGHIALVALQPETIVGRLRQQRERLGP